MHNNSLHDYVEKRPLSNSGAGVLSVDDAVFGFKGLSLVCVGVGDGQV